MHHHWQVVYSRLNLLPEWRALLDGLFDLSEKGLSNKGGKWSICFGFPAKPFLANNPGKEPRLTRAWPFWQKERTAHPKSHVEIYRPDRKMDPNSDNPYEQYQRKKQRLGETFSLPLSYPLLLFLLPGRLATWLQDGLNPIEAPMFIRKVLSSVNCPHSYTIGSGIKDFF